MDMQEYTEEKTTQVVADAAAGITDAEPDLSEIEVKNPRIGRVQRLKEEAEREREIERQRAKRIRQEQEYIDQMSLVVDEHLRNTKEEQKYNEEFEAHIRGEVYRMHGISADKLQGMTEYRRAWYQGAAFSLFFLSLLLFVLCGLLHGFGSEISLFMALYTALSGALLSHGQKRSAFLTVLIRAVYLCLFPVMMVVFVCYELGYEEYSLLVPVCTVAAVAVLLLGSVSYFIYDPYRADRRSRRKANHYLRDMEKAAEKEVRLKEKAYGKQEKKAARAAAYEEKKAARAAEHTARKNARAEKKAARKNAREEKKAARAAERSAGKSVPETLRAWRDAHFGQKATDGEEEKIDKKEENDGEFLKSGIILDEEAGECDSDKGEG